MSLGGTCVANPKGWEVGTYEVELSTAGKLIFGRDVLVRRCVRLSLKRVSSECEGITANSRNAPRSCTGITTSV